MNECQMIDGGFADDCHRSADVLTAWFLVDVESIQSPIKQRTKYSCKNFLFNNCRLEMLRCFPSC